MATIAAAAALLGLSLPASAHFPTQPCQGGLVDHRRGWVRDFTVYYGWTITPLTDGTTNGYELLIIEPQNFTTSQIAAVRGANPGALLYGYVNAGAVEEWRDPYYDQAVAAGVLVGPYAGYPDEQVVDVNQAGWRDIVTAWIDNTVGSGGGQYGLDGVFLDNVPVGYFQYPEVISEDDERDYVAFIRSWMDGNGLAGKSIIANQGVEISEANGPHPGLRAQVDGIMYENLFSNYPASIEWYDYSWLYPEILSVLDTYVEAGKHVLVLDYPYDGAQAESYLDGLYCRGWERGYLVCASDSSLMAVHNNSYQPDGGLPGWAGAVLLEVHPNERAQGPGGAPMVGAAPWTPSGLGPGSLYQWKTYEFDGGADLRIHVCAQCYSTSQNAVGQADRLQLRIDGQIPLDMWGIMSGTPSYQWDGDVDSGNRLTLEFRPPGLTAGLHTLELWADETPVIWWVKAGEI